MYIFQRTLELLSLYKLTQANKPLNIFKMLCPIFLIFSLVCGFCTENTSYEEKVKYLGDLVDEEIKLTQSYKPRTNNEDFIGGSEKSLEIHDFGKFDFIIVGSGTAGSVVANRLSENEKWKILLLEAGDSDDDYTDIPLFFEALALSDRDWGYLISPQKNGCFGMKNNQFPYIRGKMLGGSGSLNAVLYSRGTKEDYDKWEKNGNAGWSWQEVFKYFKKLENFQDERINFKYRGFGGPVNVAHTKPVNILHESFVRANEEIGIPYVEDYNAEKFSGVSHLQHSIENGKRVSGANYVRKAWNRINFNLTLKAFVTKILIQKNTKTAYGVEFVKDGRRYLARATKEVIVSGGSVNSPQLLMLSGIGPKKELERYGIEVIKDSPVGKFMKYHVGFRELFFKSNYFEPTISKSDLIKQYLAGIGPYTLPANQESVSYFNVRNKSSPRPNMEIAFVPPKAAAVVLPQFFNYKDEFWNILKGINHSTEWNLNVYFLHPASSGTLTLKSANPKDFPLIDPKLFENEEDLEDMYRGIKVALKLAETSIGKKFNLSLDFNIPSCSKETYKSKAYWYCALKQIAYPSYHLSSTAKMGPPNDPLAVVDTELKVYGINNLRVVDASIVPSTVSGHLNAAVFMIGEKGADLIKMKYLNDHY